MSVTGILLAAGAGTRAGGPKSLRPGWIARAVTLLHNAGCSDVIVVLGAAPEAPVPGDPRVRAVIAENWNDGMSHSLRAGLLAAAQSAGGTSTAGASAAGASAASTGTADTSTDARLERAALITLVDYPDMPLSVVRRVLDASGELRQAVVDGRPVHPVFVASHHWQALADSIAGDHGGRDYLLTHGVTAVESADLWSGRDVDE